MKVEVGQDACGEWAWMVRDQNGRAIMSADGFASEEAAIANSERTLIDFALFIIRRHIEAPPIVGPDAPALRSEP